MNYTTVLFDLDGTLTDPKMGITRAVQYALEQMDMEVPDAAKLEAFIGPPLHLSFMEHCGMNETEAWEAVMRYREYYQRTGIYENQLYGGIPELLQLLHRQGRKLYVATSKPTVFAAAIVENVQLNRWFNGVCGSELDGARSDKTELLRAVIVENDIDRDRTVMIGDRKYDLIGARGNGIASIGVGYGYGSEEEIRKERPMLYCPTVKHLINAFVSL
ncbi:HAD family hydrolase [Paenibacillus piri]|uniref:HAD family hydrolase n=2 Tax=Paenibacillus piri TaxID=2547395 RepID=A0A4R5KTF0_9BACL|nr:HAD family hydrolase [Paenibacillus piri]